ncbi:MAG: hypothetical protein JSS31_12475 [Proteobacteria bacterium]|nr:hypothetical protein [Pseudomonadota bacterium]MBS0494742.1 hypothetical protein [Pseudomonadota bacterium]
MAKPDDARQSGLSQSDLYLYVAAAAVTLYTGWAVKSVGFAWPALVLLPVLVLLLPPSRARISQKISFLPGLAWSLVMAFVFVLFMATSMGEVKLRQQAENEAKMQRESATRIAKLKADREAEYTKNKAAIIAEVEQQLANNQPREALATINKYMMVTKDPNLGRHLHRANIQTMRLDLANEANLSPERRADIYKALMQEDLNKRPEYEQKLRQMESLLAAKRQQQEDASKRAAMEANVKGQFSSYDGSHRKVEAAIKARLKDPGSYEHVETRYSVNADSITVHTTYRARNSFNALVPGTAVATVDANGNVLSLN